MIEQLKLKLHPEVSIFHDSEYVSYISDIIQHREVRTLENFTHHKSVNCLEHSLHVSYMSYQICKKLHLDYKSVARGALLHDFFLYDWREVKHDEGMHAFIHPTIALDNANQYFDLNAKEQDIIVKHMWPLTKSLPRYKESVVVTFVDKYCAITEAFRLGKLKKVHRLKEIFAL